MLCPNCGTILPDGSKFCIECGSAMSASADNAPTFSADPVSFTVPGVPEPITPVAPFTGLDPDLPEPESEPKPETETEIKPEPESTASGDPFAAFNAAAMASGLVNEAPPPTRPLSQEPAPSSYAPAAAPVQSAPQHPMGYSIPGQSSAAGAAPLPASPVPGGEKKTTSSKKWLVWTILAAVMLIVISAAVSISSILGGGEPEPEPAAVETTTQGGSLSGIVSSKLDDAVETWTAPLEEVEDAIEEGIQTAEEQLDSVLEIAADGNLTLEQCVDLIDESLTDSDMAHDFEVADDWVDVYIWEDGTFAWALSAYSGDQEDLRDWQELLDMLADLSGEYQKFFSDNGHDDVIVCLNLMDDTELEYFLSLFVDGETIYDVVTGIDLFGLDEIEE